jgi:SAM-dependent methyltransferase
VIVELAEAGTLTGRLLDVGCGTGEHTLLAASRGADALGIDVSPVAIQMATNKARERGIPARFAVADALELYELGREFDVVLDSGVFHVFAGDERPRYAAGLAGVVRQGGIVYVTTFCAASGERPREWGPPAVTEGDVRAAFGAGWRVEEVRPCLRRTNRAEIGTLAGEAWLAVVRRTEQRSSRSPVRAHAGRAERSTRSLARELRAFGQAVAAAGLAAGRDAGPSGRRRC